VAPDGKFRLKTDSGTISYVLEAQADGYWPERLTNQINGAAEVHINIELKKAPLYAGVVLTSAGELAAGATLAVCGPREWAQMNQAGKLHLGAHNSAAGTVSDAEGRFRLPTKYAPEFVVAAHERGFAEVPFSKVSSNTIVTLQPWGRIEGILILGGHSRADETISLGSGSFRDPDATRLSLFMSAKTDANGRFVFETVPAGERRVDWCPGFRDGKTGVVPLSHGVPVAVKPGETAQVTLGGSGRPVIGVSVTPLLTLPGPPKAGTACVRASERRSSWRAFRPRRGSACSTKRSGCLRVARSTRRVRYASERSLWDRDRLP
jgi:hypothetical protein